MADLIYRMALMKKVRCKNNTDCEHCDFYTDGDTWCDGSVYGTTIMQTPAVDAVEVVRCRKCAKDGLFTCPMCYIENHELIFINHDPDFFCGAGERKDNG